MSDQQDRIGLFHGLNRQLTPHEVVLVYAISEQFGTWALGTEASSEDVARCLLDAACQAWCDKEALPQWLLQALELTDEQVRAVPWPAAEVTA